MYPGYKPIDIRLPLGLDIFAATRDYASSLSLQNADLLTNLAIRYILENKVDRGVNLLKATNKAIKEEITFLKTGEKPSFQELRNYIIRYNDEIVSRMLNRSPLFSYDIEKLNNYYKINTEYLKLACRKGDENPFIDFIKTVRIIQNTNNIRIVRYYEYKLEAYIKSLGIKEIYDLNNILEHINLMFI